MMKVSGDVYGKSCMSIHENAHWLFIGICVSSSDDVIVFNLISADFKCNERVQCFCRVGLSEETENLKLGLHVSVMP